MPNFRSLAQSTFLLLLYLLELILFAFDDYLLISSLLQQFKNCNLWYVYRHHNHSRRHPSFITRFPSTLRGFEGWFVRKSGVLLKNRCSFSSGKSWKNCFWTTNSWFSLQDSLLNYHLICNCLRRKKNLHRRSLEFPTLLLGHTSHAVSNHRPYWRPCLWN